GSASPGGSAWAFQGPAGVTGGGGILGAPVAADGTHVGYLQTLNGQNGSISQKVLFAGGQADITFNAANAAGAGESVAVYFDEKLVGTFSPTTSFRDKNNKLIL